MNNGPIYFELEKRHKDDLENIKKLYEIQTNYFKHVTTISIGSILIAVAFLEKLFSSPSWPIIFFVSVFFFALSIAGSLFAMSEIGRTIEILTIIQRQSHEENLDSEWEKVQKKQGRIRRYESLLKYSFLIGLVSFLIFAATAVRNTKFKMPIT